MPIDRARIRKGMFIRSDEPLPGYTPPRRKAAHDDNLSIATDKLEQLAEERAQLAARMTALQQAIASITAKKS